MPTKLPRSITDTWGDQYIPLKDAAQLLGVSPDALRDAVAQKKLTGKQQGVYWYVLLADVRARLDAPAAEEVAPS